MANINELLQQMLTAVYGKDVRQSIHDAIQQCYDEVGYYKPSMDASGRLSWTRSKDSLPAAPSVSIKGPTGDPGKTPVKGVDYYTEEEKTEFIKALGEAFKVTWATEEVIDTYRYSGNGSPDNGHVNDTVSYGGPGWYKIGTSIVYLDENDYSPYGYHYSEDGSRWRFDGPEDVYLVDEDGNDIEDEEDKYSITLSKVAPYVITDDMLPGGSEPGSGAVVESYLGTGYGFLKRYSTDDYNDDGYILHYPDPEQGKDLEALIPGCKYKLGDFEFVAGDDFHWMAQEFGTITSEDDGSTWEADGEGVWCSGEKGVITLCCVEAAPEALPDYLGTGYGFLKRYSTDDYNDNGYIIDVCDPEQRKDLDALIPGCKYTLGDFEFVATDDMVMDFLSMVSEFGTITSEDDGSEWIGDGSDGVYCPSGEGVITLCCVETPVPESGYVLRIQEGLFDNYDASEFDMFLGGEGNVTGNFDRPTPTGIRLSEYVKVVDCLKDGWYNISLAYIDHIYVLGHSEISFPYITGSCCGSELEGDMIDGVLDYEHDAEDIYIYRLDRFESDITLEY